MYLCVFWGDEGKGWKEGLSGKIGGVSEMCNFEVYMRIRFIGFGWVVLVGRG